MRNSYVKSIAAFMGAALLLLGSLPMFGAERVRRIELPNGDVYEGQIENDLRSGQG